jgi:hypothetical protein
MPLNQVPTFANSEIPRFIALLITPPPTCFRRAGERFLASGAAIADFKLVRRRPETTRDPEAARAVDRLAERGDFAADRDFAGLLALLFDERF